MNYRICYTNALLNPLRKRCYRYIRISSQITIGNNLSSKKSGLKGIIKITDKYFESSEINRIALIAPNAVLNVIKDYKVVEKQKLTLPNRYIFRALQAG